MPPFGFITEDQVKAFWGEDDRRQQRHLASRRRSALGGTAEPRTMRKNSTIPRHQDRLLKAEQPEMEDREITDERKNQAQDFFAKIQIYKEEYEDKAASGELDKRFYRKDQSAGKAAAGTVPRTALFGQDSPTRSRSPTTRSQQYIAEHPELDPAEKKAKAEEILDRAKNGEDFATLANRIQRRSRQQGPERRTAGRTLQGRTERAAWSRRSRQAALALEPGQIAPNVVESDFGYHIIKLEKKNETKDAKGQPTPTYDVRHILIATTFKDPENPAAREMPVKEYVRQKLEQETREKAYRRYGCREPVSGSRRFRRAASFR